MAFTIANWACVSESLNQGQELVVPFLGVATVLNAPNMFIYGTPNDTVAQVSAANYFLGQYKSLSVGDWIQGNATDGTFSLRVSAVSATSLVTVPNGLGVPNTNLLYAAVPVTSAEFLGMFATPKLLIAAPGANKLIVVEQMAMSMTFNSAAYAAGGVVAAQYDATINGGGVAATVPEAAADFFAAASTTFRSLGSSAIAPFSTTVNKGIYLSNATAAFTTGNSALIANVWYRIVPTV